MNRNNDAYLLCVVSDQFPKAGTAGLKINFMRLKPAKGSEPTKQAEKTKISQPDLLLFLFDSLPIHLPIFR